MQCRFDITKAVQAISVIFNEESADSLEYLRVLKLLYIAERESIAETGRPIIGDRIVAMNNGPVMSTVYNLAKERPVNPAQWEAWNPYIRSSGRYLISLVENPGVGKLTKYEMSKIRDVTKRYIGTDQWEIVEETHRFIEWIRNHKKDTSVTISMQNIFEALGKQNEFAGVSNAVKEEMFFEDFFKG